MDSAIETLGRVTYAVLIVLAVTGVALGVYGAIGRKVLVENRRDDHEVLGHVAGITGVINAVLFAIIVFAAWNYYDRARDVVAREAGVVWQLWNDVEASETHSATVSDDESPKVFADSLRDRIGGDLRGYIAYVAAEEWRMASWDTTANDTATRLLRDAYETVLRNAQTDTPTMKALAQEMVKRFNTLVELRQERLAYGTERAIQGVVWIVLLFGGLLCFGCCALIGFSSPRLHAWIMALIGVSFGLIVTLIVALDTPFHGLDPISNERFVNLQTNINDWEEREAREHREAQELEHRTGEAREARPPSRPTSHKHHKHSRNGESRRRG